MGLVDNSNLLQCRLFGHVVLGILHGLTYEKSGHKAHTYRQIEQYPDPKRRGPIAPEGFVLLPIVDPFIIKGSTINKRMQLSRPNN